MDRARRPFAPDHPEPVANDRLAARVDAAVGQRSRRQRDVDPLARESRVEFGFREHGAAGGEQAGDLVLGNIERGATGLALVCWDGAERFHQLGDATLLAKPLDAQGFESGTVSGGSQQRYQCDGVLSTSDDVRANVDKILSALMNQETGDVKNTLQIKKIKEPKEKKSKKSADGDDE